ncbi:hypothetical protein INT46_007688 [Mucor plumbeus]|uniref:Transposase n=1 Tax=Mucor plumbeus TaxID=97098 RepID=A0A8H7R0U2_9FUNG|nr:hypothetical protein INT46_007688 [Mucor plumbeus]
MTRTLPYDVQYSIKSLLLRNTLLCSIKKMYPTIGMANLSKYRRDFLEGAQASTGGRSSKVSTATQYLDGLRGAQEYLRSTNISMSLSGAEKLLNGMGFKAKRKNKTNFVSAANKKFRLVWARRRRQLTVSDWRKWVFSGKTRVNIGGSDSESFYWSDVPGTNRPHQVRPQVQGSGYEVMFWCYISGDGPGYGTSIIDETIDSHEYVEILKTSLMQTLEYYGKQVKNIRFQQDKATPHKSNITKAWFSQNGFSVDEILDWPPQNSDLNPIERIRGDLKHHLDTYPIGPATK